MFNYQFLKLNVTLFQAQIKSVGTLDRADTLPHLNELKSLSILNQRGSVSPFGE